MHKSISRYLFSIGGDGLVCKELCKTQPTSVTPHNASHVHSVIMLMLLAGMGSAGLDPMVHIFAIGSAVATLCILILQLGVSAAVVLFFRRMDNNENQFTVFWAPLLSMVCMSVTIILVVNNLQSLSGSDSSVVKMIPWFIAGCALMGYGMSLKRNFKVRA